jgi:hypothetical protein
MICQIAVANSQLCYISRCTNGVNGTRGRHAARFVVKESKHNIDSVLKQRMLLEMACHCLVQVNRS